MRSIELMQKRRVDFNALCVVSAANVGRAKELGMDTLALTDHGVMYGALDFYNSCKKGGIKPIIGMEAYMAVGAHNDRSAKGKGYFHTLLLAQARYFRHCPTLGCRGFELTVEPGIGNLCHRYG